MSTAVRIGVVMLRVITIAISSAISSARPVTILVIKRAFFSTSTMTFFLSCIRLVELSSSVCVASSTARM